MRFSPLKKANFGTFYSQTHEKDSDSFYFPEPIGDFYASLTVKRTDFKEKLDMFNTILPYDSTRHSLF